MGRKEEIKTELAEITAKITALYQKQIDLEGESTGEAGKEIGEIVTPKIRKICEEILQISCKYYSPVGMVGHLINPIDDAVNSLQYCIDLLKRMKKYSRE